MSSEAGSDARKASDTRATLPFTLPEMFNWSSPVCRGTGGGRGAQGMPVSFPTVDSVIQELLGPRGHPRTIYLLLNNSYVFKQTKWVFYYH